MQTLEGEGKDFEVNSLVDSEPVEVMEVLGYMGTGMKVENSTESKVLYSLKLGQVGLRDIEEERVTLIEFRGDNRVNKSSSCVRSEKLSNRTNILQDDERGGNSFGNMQVKRQGVIQMSTKQPSRG